MVHARLAIPRTVDCIPLAEFDLVQLVQLIDLPSDKSVVVRVRVSRQELAPPIDTGTKGFEVILNQQIRSTLSWSSKGLSTHRRNRWEILQPVMRVGELLNLAPRDITGFHDLELVCKAGALRSNFAFLCLVYSSTIRLTFRWALILDRFLFYRRFNVIFKVGTELLDFTDDFVGRRLERRVSDIILGERKQKKRTVEVEIETHIQ